MAQRYNWAPGQESGKVITGTSSQNWAQSSGISSFLNAALAKVQLDYANKQKQQDEMALQELKNNGAMEQIKSQYGMLGEQEEKKTRAATAVELFKAAQGDPNAMNAVMSSYPDVFGGNASVEDVGTKIKKVFASAKDETELKLGLIPLLTKELDPTGTIMAGIINDFKKQKGKASPSTTPSGTAGLAGMLGPAQITPIPNDADIGQIIGSGLYNLPGAAWNAAGPVIQSGNPIAGLAQGLGALSTVKPENPDMGNVINTLAQMYTQNQR